MGKIIVTKTSAVKTFTLAGEEVNVKGEVKYVPSTMAVERVSGSFYRKPNQQDGGFGTFIGSFDGRSAGGELRYSISNVSVENTTAAASALEEVKDSVQEIIRTEEGNPETEQ